jgi:hypothetical protein
MNRLLIYPQDSQYVFSTITLLFCYESTATRHLITMLHKQAADIPQESQYVFSTLTPLFCYETTINRPFNYYVR